MKLFYLTVGKRWGRFDLFVHANAPSEAASLWAAHFKDDRAWMPNKVRVHDLSQLALCPGVLQWEAIPATLSGFTEP